MHKGLKSKVGAAVIGGLMVAGLGALPAEAAGVTCPTNCVKVYAGTYTQARDICTYAHGGTLVGGDGPYAGVKRDSFNRVYRWCQK